MPEADSGTEVDDTSRPASLVIDDVHVTYRVFQDQRPTLRRFMANGFRARPYRSVEAVRGVSLVAHQGDAIGIVGRNGSGKSTLLRAVAGLLPPTHGAVYAKDTPVLLGVKAALQAELSGRRNVILGATALGMSRTEVKQRFDEIVDFAGVRDFIDMPLRTYSSGMTARLHFSIASAVAPDILMIDEALAVGDAEFQTKSRARILELLEGSRTVFVVSHNLNQLTKLTNRVIWMDKGRLLADGDPDEVIEQYREATDSAS